MSINAILEPVLFQVIGSTPSSIAENIGKSNAEGNTQVGVHLVSISLFAAAVNRPTLEAFIARPELAQIRPVLQNHFTVSGKTNMTAISLLGHCLLTSDITNGIKFAQELKRKMGQSSIWSGTFENGSVSEKQKKIFLERQKSIRSSDAALLGSGFFKFFGIDATPWTNEENAFWGRASSIPRARAEPAFATNTARTTANMPASSNASGSRPSPATTANPTQHTRTPSSQGKQPVTSDTFAHVPAPAAVNVTPPRTQSAPRTVAVTIGNQETVEVSETAVNYYLAVSNGNRVAMEDSIRHRGVEGFNRAYEEAARLDPEMKGRTSSTVG